MILLLLICCTRSVFSVSLTGLLREDTVIRTLATKPRHSRTAQPYCGHQESPHVTALEKGSSCRAFLVECGMHKWSRKTLLLRVLEEFWAEERKTCDERFYDSMSV